MADEAPAVALEIHPLAKPSFAFNFPLPCESANSPAFALLPVLDLPKEYGNIYVGETFHCLVNFRNISATTFTDVTIKIELESGPGESSILFDNSNSPIASVADGRDYSFSASCLVAKTGPHTLKCRAHFVPGVEKGTERRTISRKYKFQVLSPVQVALSTRFIKDHVYVEAQLTNMTTAPLYIQSVELEPAVGYLASEIVATGHTPSPQPARGKGPGIEVEFLRPVSVRQHLFHIKPTASDHRGGLEVGNVHVGWRTQFGDAGRMAVAVILSKAPVDPPVGVTIVVKSAPHLIEVEETFDVVVTVTNHTKASATLHLMAGNAQYHMDDSAYALGIVGQALGVLGPGESCDRTITLFSVAPGVHMLSGMKIVDEQTAQEYASGELLIVHIRAREMEL